MIKDPMKELAKNIASHVYMEGSVQGTMSSSTYPDNMGGNNLDIEYTFFNQTAKIHMFYGAKDHADFEKDSQDLIQKGRELLCGKLEKDLSVTFSETGTGKANITVSGENTTLAGYNPTNTIQTRAGQSAGIESLRDLKEKLYGKE